MKIGVIISVLLLYNTVVSTFTLLILWRIFKESFMFTFEDGEALRKEIGNN